MHIHREGYKIILVTILILAGINILSIGLALLFSGLGNITLMLIILANSLLFNWGITFCLRSKERRSVALRNLFV